MKPSKKPPALAANIRRIRKRYVRVAKMGDFWATYLQVDHQGFEIVSRKSKTNALWFGRMLSIALSRMIDQQALEPQ